MSDGTNKFIDAVFEKRTGNLPTTFLKHAPVGLLKFRFTFVRWDSRLGQ